MLATAHHVTVFAQAAGGDVIDTLKGKAIAALTACIIVAVMFAAVEMAFGSKKQQTAHTVSHAARLAIAAAVFVLASAILIVGKKIADATGLL